MGILTKLVVNARPTGTHGLMLRTMSILLNAMLHLKKLLQEEVLESPSESSSFAAASVEDSTMSASTKRSKMLKVCTTMTSTRPSSTKRPLDHPVNIIEIVSVSQDTILKKHS